MVLECACGKTYRVRKGTHVAGMKCPACGALLHPGGQEPPAPPKRDRGDPVRIEGNGEVRCPTCGDRFPVTGLPAP